MPVSGQLTPDELREALEPWMARQLHDATDVRTTNVVIPQSSGFSNETFLVDAAWKDADGDEHAELVLRSQAQGHQVFPEPDPLQQQFETMRILGERTDVPVPRMRWAESDPSVIGRAFFVMDRLTGNVAGDAPAWTVEGYVIDMDPASRREWHRNGIGAMARVHAVDWREVGLAYLDQPHHGALGPEQRRNYLDHYRTWALNGRRHDVIDAAWAWLTANWPDDGEHVELCWGDARPGNLMYQGTEVVGVFDWEMVALGNSESDLGWWCFLQRFHTDGYGVALPEGLLDRAETIAEWERLRGRPARHVDFYERLGGFQFALVMVRLAESMGIPDMGWDNPVVTLTGQLIASS